MDKEIKNLPSKEIKNYISNNKNVELLDVRTPEEWETIGKPDGEKLGIKTHYITIARSPDPDANKGFVAEVKNKADISKDLLIICRSGARSMMACQLLSKEGFNCTNISDGFEGNGENQGWKKENLPSN
jgi:rhodanese-related sulfurtransferase